MTAGGATGLLAGVTVVELASELAASCGRMLAGMGAEVILVEPPGGHPCRHTPPFAEELDDPGENSLWWWHHQAGKRSVVLDLGTPADNDVLDRLISRADVVLEAEAPGHLDALGVSRDELCAAHPRLVWASVTPWGTMSDRSRHPVTDLTIAAEGGPAWSCGYDDHTLPPVRPGGDQSYQTASMFALLGILTSLVQRQSSGRGQHVDVAAVAAAHVTTEAATYEWLVAGRTVQRQTGRHASVHPTTPTMATSADGRLIATGVPPRSVEEYEQLLDWLDNLGVSDEFDELGLLVAGIDRGGVTIRELGSDEFALAIFGAGREAMMFIASKMTADDYFAEAQRRGFPCGIVKRPDELLSDPQLQARAFPVPVWSPGLGREILHPGAPFRSDRTVWSVTGAPRLDEHRDEILGSVPQLRYGRRT